MVYKWLRIAQQTLYPPTCVLCGQASDTPHDLCGPCTAELPINHTACRRCALPLPAEANPLSLCGRCQQHPPRYERLLAPYLYQRPINRLILDLKFNRCLGNARLLGELWLEQLSPLIDQPPDVLVPVPLHASRLAERGYNQALELARPLSKHYGLPLDYTGLRRSRPTRPQAELDTKARAANVRKAFEATGDWRGKHVAVIDDVVTTGHTVEELTKTLLRAGAAEVEVWAFARTPIT